MAGSIASRGQPGCPDLAYRCSTFEPGEPVVIGALFPSADGPEVRALREAIEARGGEFLGRTLTILPWGTSCIPEGGTEGARELATDPPDGPPVVAVIAGGCPEAAVPAAQILSDSGITLLVPESLAIPPTAGPARYTLPVLRGSDPVSVESAVETILRVSQELALTEDGRLLIPRTPLRDSVADAFGVSVR